MLSREDATTRKTQQILKKSKVTKHAIALLACQLQNLPIQIDFDLVINCNQI